MHFAADCWKVLNVTKSHVTKSRLLRLHFINRFLHASCIQIWMGGEKCCTFAPSKVKGCSDWPSSLLRLKVHTRTDPSVHFRKAGNDHPA